MYEHRSAKILPARQFAWRLAWHVALVAAIWAASLLGGMAGYISLGGMSNVDAFLNTSMLLGGMGPVGELPNNATKLFAGWYALYSALVLIVSATILTAPVAHRFLHRLHAEKPK